MNILEASTEPLAHRVAAGLTKISLAIKSHAWKEAGKSRVTPLQAQTLSILRLRQDHTATVSAIAEELAVALPTASEVVRNLEEKGWLKKQRSSKDARIVTVTLSPKGRRKAEEAGGADFLTSAADLFQPADQVSLLRMLITMIRTLQERGEIPLARMCVTCKFSAPIYTRTASGRIIARSSMRRLETASCGSNAPIMKRRRKQSGSEAGRPS
ncbi:MAG: MarR family transcriptional regulator [Nitrospiraceae bacterium]